MKKEEIELIGSHVVTRVNANNINDIIEIKSIDDSFVPLEGRDIGAYIEWYFNTHPEAKTWIASPELIKQFREEKIKCSHPDFYKRTDGIVCCQFCNEPLPVFS